MYLRYIIFVFIKPVQGRNHPALDSNASSAMEFHRVPSFSRIQVELRRMFCALLYAVLLGDVPEIGV